MSEFVVICQQLSKTFQEGEICVNVLSNINFTVKAGESIAIVGSSGSGKSTLLHLLGGLDKPTLGSVSLLGADFSILSETKRSHLRNQFLGFVYQFHHLLPEFTALENVMMPLLIRRTSLKEAEQKAASILEKVGLINRLKHKPGELSGGERQRAAIARALVTQPACLLADEPTGNLDRKNAQNIFTLMLELNSNLNTSLVIVTHDKNLARQVGTIYHLTNGNLDIG